MTSDVTFMEMTLEDGRGELPLSSAPASELEADVALLQESANPSADASSRSRSRSKKRSASPESDSQTLADDDKTGSDNTTTAAAAAAVTTADGPVRKARRARKSTYTVRKVRVLASSWLWVEYALRGAAFVLMDCLLVCCVL